MITGNRFDKLLRQVWGALMHTPICPPMGFPNEIVLQFLEYMPARSLIVTCANRSAVHERHLIPLANILPARQLLSQVPHDVFNVRAPGRKNVNKKVLHGMGILKSSFNVIKRCPIFCLLHGRMAWPFRTSLHTTYQE